MANQHAISTTKRSMDFLRERGYSVTVVEQWLSFPERKGGIPTGKTIRVRRDCFNFADILAVHPEKKGTLYIQTTTRANQAARRGKILLSGDAVVVLQAGNQIHVHGWAEAGEVAVKGKRRKIVWEASIFEAKLENGKVNFYPVLEEEAF